MLKTDQKSFHFDGLWSRFMKSGYNISTYGSVQFSGSSSIWTGFKHAVVDIQNNARWVVNNGQDIYFWWDIWLEHPLSLSCNIPLTLKARLNSKVVDFTQNGKQNIPRNLRIRFPDLYNETQNTIITLDTSIKDRLIWTKPVDGDLIYKKAYDFYRLNREVNIDFKDIWLP